MVIKREDPRNYSSPEEFFLTEDALKCVEFDISFSCSEKYYCDAGCKVCYIKDSLSVLKPKYNTYVPEVITDADVHRWDNIFSHFFVTRTYDDLMYLQKQHSNIFNWYIENSEKFEFGFTDNSLFRNKKILMESNFKNISEITLSAKFIQNTYIKTLQLINEYLTKFKVHNLKIICETPQEMKFPEVIKITEELESKVGSLLMHSSFTDKNFDLNHEKYTQNNCVFSWNNKLYKIFKESISLHNNSFYFSADDASDINIEPFHVLPSGDFDTKGFLPIMIAAKLKTYSENLKELEEAEVDEYFKEYFRATQKFKVNTNYNFIPNFMLESNCSYAFKLKQLGFLETEVGLYLQTAQNDPIIPIVEYK